MPFFLRLIDDFLSIQLVQPLQPIDSPNSLALHTQAHPLLMVSDQNKYSHVSKEVYP